MMETSFGSDALISIIVNLICIGVSWWALQSIRLDQLLKANRVIQARALYILLAIALGSIVANFFLDYLLWSRQWRLIWQ